MSRDREREKKRDQDDEEDAYERRKLERKLRDKEAAYQEVGSLGERSIGPQYKSEDCKLIGSEVHNDMHNMTVNHS